MPPLPNYDLDYRFRRALSPDGLTTVETCVTAIAEAIGDARNAGLNPEDDAGVLLLSRHLGQIARGRNPVPRLLDDAPLRERCHAKLAELLRLPTIVVLARGGVGNPERRRRFLDEARSHLSALACALAFAEADFQIVRTQDSSASLELAAPGLWVRIDGHAEAGTEVTAWTTPSGRTGHARNPVTHDIAVLLDVPRLARTLSRELRLRAPSTPAQPALV